MATDLFEWRKNTYLLVVDYYSRYIEILKLMTTTSADVIRQLKSIFARNGIPEELVSDNSPQYTAEEFTCFAKKYGFQHQTSSPKFPQANSEAERAVETIKALLNKTNDPFLGLLAYHSTPQENGYSPAELLMGHKIRSMVPVIPKLLHPELPNHSQLCSKEKKTKRAAECHKM